MVLSAGKDVDFGTVEEEEKCEDMYDTRDDADLEKGRLKFPNDKLYGRDEELRTLREMFNSFNKDSANRVVFLGGYSGIGKSALVDHFIKEISGRGSNTTAFITGKFSQLKAGDPFSAISQALNQHISQLTGTCSCRQLKPLKKRLAEFDICLGNDNASVLAGTIAPALNDLLEKAAKGEEGESAKEKVVSRSMTGADINVIKCAFINLIKALATQTRPLTAFIDDCQWADDASLQLLSALLKEKALPYFLFIGAYRDNEVKDDHDFFRLMKDVEEARGSETVQKMYLSNLHPEEIAMFIADCIGRKPDEVIQIAEAVYAKTLGNIFFVRQALEELVRKNAIYYDVVFFQWQFSDVKRVELDQFLTDDVLGMVQSKLISLPEPLQKALALAAYTNSVIEFDLLAALLAAESVKVDPPTIHKLMYRAFIEGLVVSGDGTLINGRGAGKSCSYKFAHDRIREAAYKSVPAGAERNHLLLHVSSVLLGFGSTEQDDWMLFTAARHINSVPAEMTNAHDVAELNLRVGKLAIAKGSFGDAVTFLRAGLDRLGSNGWKEHYQTTLELTNTLVEADYYTGEVETALERANEVFENSATLTDKGRAQLIYIESMTKNNSDYAASVNVGVKILKLYRIDVPNNPTDGQVKREKMRFWMTFRGRSLTCLTNLPLATDEFTIFKFKIAQKTVHLASKAKLHNLESILGRRMLRECISKKLITKDVPFLVTMLGTPMRKDEQYEEAVSFAQTGVALMERFSGDKSLDSVKQKFALYATLSCLRVTFRDATEVFSSLSKSLIAKGENEMGLASGMLGVMAYYNASLSLNSLLEPKLLLLEESALRVGMKPFVYIFRLLRQFMYNLKGGKKSSANPTQLKGEALSEQEVVALFEGGALKMMIRDMGIMRLQLAVLFNHEPTMIEMLERLDENPVHDMPIERQHLRMSFMGFAAMIIAPKSKCKKHKNWAKTSMEFFDKLTKFGSPNAKPVSACMRALYKPSVALFDHAIQVCGDAGLYHLAGFMNERCGMMLLDANGVEDEYVNYFRCALWCYRDWGAENKVQHLQQTYTKFLGSSIMAEPEPSLTKSMRKRVGVFGIPRGVDLSERMSSFAGSSIG